MRALIYHHHHHHGRRHHDQHLTCFPHLLLVSSTWSTRSTAAAAAAHLHLAWQATRAVCVCVCPASISRSFEYSKVITTWSASSYWNLPEWRTLKLNRASCSLATNKTTTCTCVSGAEAQAFFSLFFLHFFLARWSTVCVCLCASSSFVDAVGGTKSLANMQQNGWATFLLRLFFSQWKKPCWCWWWWWSRLINYYSYSFFFFFCSFSMKTIPYPALNAGFFLFSLSRVIISSSPTKTHTHTLSVAHFTLLH